MLRRCGALAPFVLVGLAAPGAGAASLSADCKPVFAAMEKTLLSNHTTVTTRGSETLRGVTVDGTTYLQVNGAWRKSPFTPQDNVTQSRGNLKDAKEYTCKPLPDAVVDGTPVVNFATHTVGSEDDIIDSRIAISKATGLAVSIENRRGADGAASYMTRYGYANVKAPM